MGFVKEHPWMTFFLTIAGLSTVATIAQRKSAPSISDQLKAQGWSTNPPPPLGSPQNPTADQFLQQMEKGQL